MAVTKLEATNALRAGEAMTPAAVQRQMAVMALNKASAVLDAALNEVTTPTPAQIKAREEQAKLDRVGRVLSKPANKGLLADEVDGQMQLYADPVPYHEPKTR